MQDFGDVKAQRDQGQTAVEWLGIAAVTVAVIAAIVTAAPGIGGSIQDQLSGLICQAAGCGDGVAHGGIGELPPGSEAPPTRDRDDDRRSTTTTGTEDNQSESGETGDGGTPSTPTGVTEQVTKAKELLAPGGGFLVFGRGVTSGDLRDLKELLEEMSPADRDALFQGLSDDELKRWLARLADNGMSQEERRKMWAELLANASPETLKRLASFPNDFQPSFQGIVDDAARKGRTSPVTNATYEDLVHQLLRVEGNDSHAIDPNDIEQGYIGDCWMIASMAALANSRPDAVANMITTNPNGTYTVTLYDNGKEVKVTVLPDLPSDNKNPVFVDNPSTHTEAELWPHILEKASAQYYGDYQELVADWPEKALELYTGENVTVYNTQSSFPTLQEMDTMLSNGGAVLGSTPGSAVNNTHYNNGNLVTGHAYWVQSVDTQAGTVTVANPWGIASHPPFTMTYADFQASFHRLDTLK